MSLCGCPQGDPGGISVEVEQRRTDDRPLRYALSDDTAFGGNASELDPGLTPAKVAHGPSFDEWWKIGCRDVGHQLTGVESFGEVQRDRDSAFNGLSTIQAVGDELMDVHQSRCRAAHLAEAVLMVRNREVLLKRR